MSHFSMSKSCQLGYLERLLEQYAVHLDDWEFELSRAEAEADNLSKKEKEDARRELRLLALSRQDLETTKVQVARGWDILRSRARE